jgi:hypothetical protein
MRAKDLKVGMCVAIKSGYGTRMAWVLEVGTRWYCGFDGWRCRPTVDTKVVAVAVARQYLDGPCDPDVVKPAQILDTWEEYTAWTTKQQADDRKAYERDQRRRANYQARFEKLTLGEHAELEAKTGWVRIPLDVLEGLLSPRPS